MAHINSKLSVSDLTYLCMLSNDFNFLFVFAT